MGQTQQMTITSPFKSAEDFERELKAFANKYKTTLSEHSRRISDYFEMSCFNMIVRYYERHGYTASVENLQSRRYRFKCSPSGLIGNFSYIKVMKGAASYHIYHNAPIQSAHDYKVYTTPDIVVAKITSPSETTDYYKTKKKFSYLPNSEMITFCEAKHQTPFAELMINFIGIVNELKPDCLFDNIESNSKSEHIAPSLMMSGCLSKPTERIALSLQQRYYVNMLSNLFVEPYKTTFSKAGVLGMATLTRKRKIDTLDYYL